MEVYVSSAVKITTITYRQFQEHPNRFLQAVSMWADTDRQKWKEE